MGRSKNTPRRQEGVEIRNGSSILGRVVTETPVAVLHEQELQVYQQEANQHQTQTSLDLDATANTIWRASLPPPYVRSGRQSAAATLGQRLKQIIDENATRKRRSKPPPKVASKRRKKVNFQSQDPQVIPYPELWIFQEEYLSTSSHQKKTVMLVSSSWARQEQQQQQQRHSDEMDGVELIQVLVKSWPLHQTQIEFTEEDSSFRSRLNDNVEATIIIRTANGIDTILNHCKVDDPLSAVGKAVEDGTLRFTLTTNADNPLTTIIRVYVTVARALQVGDPSIHHLPSSLSNKQSTIQKNPASALQHALGVLLKETLLSDIVLSSMDKGNKLNTVPDITAKKVYSLVDNVQYNSNQASKVSAHDRRETDKPSKIPGLVPVLRGYQQAAVEWMVRRERSSRIFGSEWELIWMVLKQNSNGSLSTFKPLYSSNHDNDNLSVKLYFYCPFMGWWVSSYEQARAVTFGDAITAAERGGILAESMGLGKTVEVLACILSNQAPYKKNNRREEGSLQTISTFSRKDDVTLGTKVSHDISMGIRSKKVPSPKQDETERQSIFSSKQKKGVSSLKIVEDKSISADCHAGENDSMAASLANLPDEEEFECTAIANPESSPCSTKERILDSMIVGVCICGQTINVNERLPIVICPSCHEPMHAACAGFNDLPPKNEASMIRHRFGKLTLDCQLCSTENCPCCVASVMDNVRSRATLIITPPAILNQWEREIQRHTAIKDAKNGEIRPLQVVVYPGIRSLCNQRAKKRIREGQSNLIHPKRLADADVVLMTFDALMGDLGHSNDNPFVDCKNGSKGRSLRRRKIYRVVPSPLLSVDWWRVCLDEAQRVETPTAASAKMALKLQAQHRWCVSGTPVGRGKLEDLYGLLLFLRFKPFSEKSWFAACFKSGHHGVDGRIQHLLHDIFWRSTKASAEVKAQMGVPEQIEKKVFLEFSSIERHFYNRQLEETLNIAGDLQRTGTGKSYKSTRQLENLSMQLHKLRAACCHPQVGSSGLAAARAKRRKGFAQLQGSLSGESKNNGYSRILTMDQILDRLIDDAKLKCEEAQRLCLMHNNAMAALAKLKVGAKARGVTFAESDARLLAHSCKLYLESLDMLSENSKPSEVIGEAIMSGCVGFRSSQKTFRDGKTLLDWQVKDFEDCVNSDKPLRQLWSRIDFEGPSKRITQIRVRPSFSLPKELTNEGEERGAWCLMFPRTCVFQVSSAAVGGEYVDIVSFDLPLPDEGSSYDAVIRGNFRTNKSKSWRLVIQSYHDVLTTIRKRAWYCGVELELYEASIGGDSLQRLHALHNASLSFKSLIDIQEGNRKDVSVAFLSGSEEMKERLNFMIKESRTIEKLYIDGILPVHQEAHRLLLLAVGERERVEKGLLELTETSPKRYDHFRDCWDDKWWNDILAMCSKYGSDREQFELCKRVHEDLNSALEGAYDRKELKARALPHFNDVNGLYHIVNLRMKDLRSAIPQGALGQCLKQFLDFSTNPKMCDILESSTCERCKKDWTWTGPMCAHCRLSLRLNQLTPEKNDRLLLLVLKSVSVWMKGGKSTGSFALARATARVDERAKRFFDVLEAYKKEKSAAERSWRVHLDLLNDLDELNMCKQAMRLSIEGEDLSKLTEAELNAVIHPVDVASSYLDHGAKQAMALANLRRNSSTLRYLKNQNFERVRRKEKTSAKQEEGEQENCVLCLSSFQDSRAVLSCGHSFHYTPCLERLMARQGNHSIISCPLRCTIRTKRNSIMMATEKRRDDGSSVNRRVVGSWGTKVARLVADVLDVSDRGEKGIVFSMWEDMLDVVEEALYANKVPYVRATSLSKIGASIKRFRSSECAVLLLNVKNGAEGLTLLEATHIFMVEPLLNCGLDIQGELLCEYPFTVLASFYSTYH